MEKREAQIWLMKSEPDVYSWDDLVEEGRAEWDGVRQKGLIFRLKLLL